MANPPPLPPLPPELAALPERLAEAIHDTWAERRRAEGWSYGPMRDDTHRLHPDLVPYEELPESERAYDRGTVEQTLRLLLSSGYRLVPPDAGASFSPPVPGASEPVLVPPTRGVWEADALHPLDQPGPWSVASLLQVWQGRDEALWLNHSELYVVLTERLLALSEPLLAYDVAQEGLSQVSGHVRLRQLQALALKRSGAARAAAAALEALWQEGHRDEETRGLLAGTEKELALQATEPGVQAAHLRRAFALYRAGYDELPDYWHGINAATLAVLLDDQPQAEALGRAVREQCLAQQAAALAAGSPADYWLLATLGEAALVLGARTDAEDWYGRAALAGAGQLANLATTRRNATWLLRHQGQDMAWLHRVLHLPRVAVFTGHRLDTARYPGPRFPAPDEGAVAEQIAAWLTAQDVGIGYAAAAAGADILFLEALLARGGEAHVVLPFEPEVFLRLSVAEAGSAWVERFQQVLRRTGPPTIASPSDAADATDMTAYSYGNALLHGLAAIHAAELDTPLLGLAVWSGTPAAGAGGTADCVQAWRAAGLPVDVITPPSIRTERGDRQGLSKDPTPNPSLGRGANCSFWGSEAPPDPRTRAERPWGDRSPEQEQAGGDTGQRSAPGRSEGAGAGAGAGAAGAPREIKAMLFGDAYHFSHLDERQVAVFVESFLGLVGHTRRTSRHAPILANTWGDGLFFVFDSVHDAGLFALELTETLGAVSWPSYGLPETLGLRLGLHAGPARRCVDPVTGRLNFVGTHVSRAARIEPITPRGQVYASEPFAALAAAQGEQAFLCEYVGQTPLAKGYGTFRSYHLRRAS